MGVTAIHFQQRTQLKVKAKCKRTGPPSLHLPMCLSGDKIVTCGPRLSQNLKRLIQFRQTRDDFEQGINLLQVVFFGRHNMKVEGKDFNVQAHVRKSTCRCHSKLNTDILYTIIRQGNQWTLSNAAVIDQSFVLYECPSFQRVDDTDCESDI
jgi:hypothetical protein